MSNSKLNINHKLITITILSLLGMFIIVFLSYKGLASSIKQEKIENAKRLVDVGMQIIMHFNGLAARSELPEAEAKRMAINTLNAAKFDENVYFWINDDEGVMLMHPYPSDLKQVGKNLIDLTDEKGNYFFRDFIETARQGGGLVEYYWFKPDSSDTTLKISYVDYFEPWAWVLGTGMYLDDINHATRQYALSALSVVFLFAVIMVALSMSLTKKTLHQLKKITIHDPLTSLNTKGYMNEHVEMLVARHERAADEYLSVIFFDIDYFKKINDTYGHVCGDQVLARVGKKIREISRPDDLCIRYGGDEFVIIILSQDKDSALNLAERIRSDIKAMTFSHNNVDFKITLSAGIALREDFESFEATLHRADQNLYKAKANGRNCVIAA